MGVSRRILALSVAVLSAGAAFTAASPADAATSRAPRSAGSTGPFPPPPPPHYVTDIREVVNQRAQEVQFYKGEDRAAFPVPAKGRWIGSMWIPWVGNESEMGKSITISWGGRVRYWVFQDYASPNNQIRYSTANGYVNSVPATGSGTGGGRKRLIVNSDGSLSMESSG
jgi:hypothetical protein